MAGFAGFDELISETTAGKRWRADWTKTYNGGTVVAGRWYDLTSQGGNPPPYAHGNMVSNYDFQGGLTDWSINGSSYWSWTAGTHLMTRTANADGLYLSQNTACVNGVSYEVMYTITRSAGTITPYLGGQAGTARSTSATFTETITCGATANAPIEFRQDASFAGTVDLVYVRKLLGFTPYTDTGTGKEAGMWHGGDVSSETKHIVNGAAWGNTTTSWPSEIYLVDMLGCYPKIVTNSSSAQTLNNSLTLPRYTDGSGVRAFYSINATNGTGAQNFTMTYTNQANTGSRGLGATVLNTASAIVPHMSHSGVAAGNYGPWLPLGSNDYGIRSVQSVQFTAASGSAGFVDLVLCRPIASIQITSQYVGAERNFVMQVPAMERIYDGAVLGLVVSSGAVIAAGTNFQGYFDFAWS